MKTYEFCENCGKKTHHVDKICRNCGFDSDYIINWGALSRLLTGSRQTVRRNSIPKIHQAVVNDLLKAMDKVISKRLDKAEAGGQKNNKISPTELD